MKVLIVEDEARLGRMLKKSLSEHAHIVNWVSTCAAANDAIVETSYDLIVVDLGLPDGDGICPSSRVARMRVHRANLDS